MAHLVKLIAGKCKWFTLAFFLFSAFAALGQATTPVYFDYKSPKSGKPESVSAFFDDFAIRFNPGSGCFSGMGWYTFRVAKTGIIDSVSFDGNLHPEVVEIGKKRIRESQIYWVCRDCQQTEGHWFTIPVLVSFTKKDCQLDPILDQFRRFWDKLFAQNESKQLLVNQNEWLLAPMYSLVVTMR